MKTCLIETYLNDVWRYGGDKPTLRLVNNLKLHIAGARHKFINILIVRTRTFGEFL